MKQSCLSIVRSVQCQRRYKTPFVWFQNCKTFLGDNKQFNKIWHHMENCCLYKEISETICFFNNFLFISFTIYKYKMKCKIHREIPKAQT